MADILFSCSACGKRLVIDEAGAGQVVACSACGESLVVPRLGAKDTLSHSTSQITSNTKPSKGGLRTWVESNSILVGLILVSLLSLVILAMKLSEFGEKTMPRQHDPQLEAHSDQAAEPQAESETLSASSPKVAFSSSSNGYDWRRADYGSKYAYCELMATTMSRKFQRTFTAGFFYSSIDEFYGTDDASVLNTKVNEIVALTVSAAITENQ